MAPLKTWKLFLSQPGLFGTTRIRLYMSQPHHFPSKYGKLLGELSRTTKVPLSTACQLKSNPALCWTAPPPGTHKYGRKSISFYLLFLIYLSLLHFLGNKHGLVENLLLSHLFSKFIS